MTENALQVAAAVLDGELRGEVRLEWDETGVLSSVSAGDVISEDDEALLQPEQLIAVPGFVDMHTHGALGYDFISCDIPGARTILQHHYQHGATTVIASLVTDTLDAICAQMTALSALCERGELAGLHMEGPWLSPHKKGAHNPDYLCAPTTERISRALAAARGYMRMVTLAPELPGASEAMRLLKEASVVVACGHSDADAEQTATAVEAGVTVATHLFNAMRPIHHRAPGPVPVLLNDQRVINELILDGVHLSDEVIRMSIHTAGARRIALVTDSMAATGLADGDYALGSLMTRVTGGVAKLLDETGAMGAIAGSTMTADQAFARCRRIGFSLPEVSRMSSTTPARALELADVGELTPGKNADICLVDTAGNLRSVYRRGMRHL